MGPSNKRIIVCCDGTWNTPKQAYPTNVFKISQAIRRDPPGDMPQLVQYHEGVGTLSLLDKVKGGAFGSSLWLHVIEAYRQIVQAYVPGDELYFFGFSRGAFTVRSTVGMMRKCGILRPDRTDLITSAYDLYRNGHVLPKSDGAKQFRRENSVAMPKEAFVVEDEDAYVPRVKFMGVWDTVGALGVPHPWVLGWGLGMLAAIPARLVNWKHQFHDVSLSRTVENAYQALAIDEKRRSFHPTLWEQHPDARSQTLEQMWFSGVHSDVGGGNASKAQSDRSLAWIALKAHECGLAFNPDFMSEFIEKPDTPGEVGPIGESRNGLWKLLPGFRRPIGRGVPPDRATYLGGISKESVDGAVVDRNLKDASYMPSNLVSYFREHPEALREAKIRRSARNIAA